jgi:hypothetical protein
MRRQIFNLCKVTHHRRKPAPEFSQGFQPPERSENIPTSRERRLNPPRHLAPKRNSFVADATRGKIHAHRGFTPCHYPNFCAKFVFTFSACGAGVRIEPGVERASAEPQEYVVTTHQARKAGGSFLLCAISSSLRLGQSLTHASRAGLINLYRTWGSAALHPRLYSDARVRGLGRNIRAS